MNNGKNLRNLALTVICGMFLSVVLFGCGPKETNQPVGSGGNGLTEHEKKAKRGDE